MQKELKSGFGIAGIIIIIAVIAVLGGFFGYQYLKLQKIQEGVKAPAAEPPVAPPAQIQPQSAEIDTGNWKTYRNEKYGFEVRYPYDLSPRFIEGRDQDNLYLESVEDVFPYPVIEVSIIPNAVYYGWDQQYGKTAKHEINLLVPYKTIGDVPAFFPCRPDRDTGGCTTKPFDIHFAGDLYIFEVSAYSVDGPGSLTVLRSDIPFHAILSTFKFIK